MIRFELAKLVRSRRPLLAGLAVAVFLALMLVGFWLYAQKQTGGDVEFRYTYENRSYFNGLTFTVYGFYFGFLLILPAFLATEGGAQLAGETGSGTLRALLTRPVSRSRVFFAKAAVLALWSVALTGGLLGACLLVGLVAVGWGDLTLYPGVLQMTDVYQHLPRDVALGRFALIWPVASLALLAPAALGLLASTLSSNAVNAAGSAIALYLVLHVVSGVPFFAELRPWLFTSHLGAWRELLQEDVDWRTVATDAARVSTSTVAFLLLGHLRFRTREER